AFGFEKILRAFAPWWFNNLRAFAPWWFNNLCALVVQQPLRRGGSTTPAPWWFNNLSALVVQQRSRLGGSIRLPHAPVHADRDEIDAGLVRAGQRIHAARRDGVEEGVLVADIDA